MEAKEKFSIAGMCETSNLRNASSLALPSKIRIVPSGFVWYSIGGMVSLFLYVAIKCCISASKFSESLLHAGSIKRQRRIDRESNKQY
jgi:hypothetical protein